MDFIQKFEKRLSKLGSLLCIGLDPDFEKIQNLNFKENYDIFEFCKQVVEHTNRFALSYKINIAFFERFGSKGLKDFEKIIEYLKQNYPDILLIADVKRGDLANTSKEYAYYYFEELGIDSVTLNPYMGLDSLVPFFEYKQKFSFVLCFTSNVDSKNFQKEKISNDQFLYQKVAETFTKNYANVGLVVGGTHMDELFNIRNDFPNTFLLIPGFGFQGGEIESVKKVCGKKSFLNVSRSIIFTQNTEENYWYSVEKAAAEIFHKMKL